MAEDLLEAERFLEASRRRVHLRDRRKHQDQHQQDNETHQPAKREQEYRENLPRPMDPPGKRPQHRGAADDQVQRYRI